jgi:hypothetical protein
MLKNIIKSLDYKNKTAENIFNILNDKNIEVTDNDFWTWAGIAELIGNESTEMLRIALTSNGMGWAVHQLGGKGLPLSRMDIQTALYRLNDAGIPGMEFLAKHTRRIESILEKYKISTTLEEIEEIKKQINIEDLKSIKIDEATDRLNNYIVKISSWNGETETEPEL